jgi:glycosyltransferase involved in cell wall biosynthesis
VARIALVHDIAGIAAIQADLLRGAGHEVDQFALPVVGASWRWPGKAFALPIRLASYLPAAGRLRRGRYDVIHIHWLTHGIVGVMAGRPFYAQAHGSDLHMNLKNPVYRRITNTVLDRAKKVFYVTPNLPAFLERYSEKLLYLPNPVEIQGIERPVPPPTELSKVVIFTRLDPVKGVDSIFPAVERLSKMVEVTALDWGPLAREYRRKYGAWVRFAKPIPHDDVGTFLRQFDVVIGQMRQGILSLMEIEALSAGRPLITAVDWSLYPVDPPPVIAASGGDAIVAAVEKLHGNPSELARLSREGRDWAVRNHGYAHHLQLLESAYFGSAKPA